MKHIKRFNEQSINEDWNDIMNLKSIREFKEFMKDVKKKASNKRWMGANAMSAAYEEGKKDVLAIMEMEADRKESQYKKRREMDDDF